MSRHGIIYVKDDPEEMMTTKEIRHHTIASLLQGATILNTVEEEDIEAIITGIEQGLSPVTIVT